MADVRRAYQDVERSTASPERLLTMLWDRLVRDLTCAEQALGDGDLLTASDNLVHAQDILFELRASLRVDAWSGGPALAALYDFAERELVVANTKKDPARVVSCRVLLEPLRDAFHEAARLAGQQRAALGQSA